jgi:two-component system response regulator ResD
MQRILIVEDDMASRFLIQTFLKSCKKEIEVIEVKNGREALKEIECKTFNLLLLDIVMPIMNGKELMKEIKSKTKYNHMSIIAITTDGDSKTEMFDLGIDDFIEKPLKKDKFLEKISKRLL